jgi:serine/threonine-protein kinase
MLTAKVAFDAPTVAMILLKILNHQPSPASSHNPGVTPAIEAVITRAIEKNKDLRFQSARELAEAFAKAVGLSGTCETWSARSEAEIAAALAAVPTPAKAAAPQPQRAAPAAAPAAARPAAPSARTMGSLGATSDGPLQVPRQTAAAKWVLALAIGLVVIGLFFLIAR